jgi:DNA-binding transcriptional ArsR family regulator
MDDIPASYSLQNIEQMRAVADPLRIRIFEALAQRAMTATQVGDELKVAAPKAHYHVRELERIGLVKLVETRERGGILEKYYRAVARNLIAPSQLLQSSEPGEVAGAITEMFNNLAQSLLTALKRISDEGAESFDSYAIGLGGDTVWMTPAEFRQALKAVSDIFEPYRQRRGVPDEREAQVTVIGFDTQLATSDESAASALEQPQQPSLRPVTAMGMVVFSREELEQVVTSAQQLDLDITGYLSFGSDVSPELVDRAIGRLRYRGVLSAPSAVREVLRRKED